jgi:uncharacterized protein
LDRATPLESGWRGSPAETRMLNDDLLRPLGVEPPQPAPAAGSGAIGLMFALASIVLMSGVVWATLAKDPLAGEPQAIATIQRTQAQAQRPRDSTPPPGSQVITLAEQTPADAAASRPTETERQQAREVETDSGVRVIRPNGTAAPQSVIVRVPDPQSAVRLAPAPDRRLVERGPHGNLPRIGADGSRPADVYARPLLPIQRTSAIKIAIVVGGLGISNQTTGDAIRRLPANVSFAFAPYGAELDRQVAQARDEGHEVLVQVPMEPFDYPDNDPGPRTLLTSATAEQNLDRLLWVMARVQGAVGVVNYMGGRYTSTEPAIAATLREVGRRGLFFLDDGSSGRSMAAMVGPGLGIPTPRADVVIDAVQRGTEIEQALARLEDIAKQKGTAIGFASALPVSVDRIAKWMKAAESRGIVFIPVSATAPLPRRS